jgi:hypothetical protein
MRQPIRQIRFKSGISGIAETCAELGVRIAEEVGNSEEAKKSLPKLTALFDPNILNASGIELVAKMA